MSQRMLQRAILQMLRHLVVEVRHTDPVGVTYLHSFSSDHQEIIMFHFYLISAIDHCMLAIERLICNVFMFLRVVTTSGPNMKRHIYSFMHLSNFHVLSIFCSEH